MGLTIKQIQKFLFYDDNLLTKKLQSLTEKGYIKETYPKINGILDDTKEKIYDIPTGKLSFPITYIFDNKWVAPTLTATDLSHMAIADKNGIRHISSSELISLFGYPKEYRLNNLSQKDVYDLFGNTICINVVENIIYNLLSLS
jgi:DNA (cytosine-5)-methyltransferase 1